MDPEPTTRRGPVLVNGPASWNTLVDLDRLPDPVPHMVAATGHRSALGGTSAGKSLALARLGVPVLLRTVLGSDDDAGRIRAALRHPHLRLAAQTVRGPSEHHLNLMAADGGRLSVYLDAAPDPGPAPASVVAALTAAPVAVLDLAAHSVPLLGEARRAGAEVWCDLHDDDGVAAFHEPFRRAADVVVISADRLPDVEAFLGARLAAGARWAVCTRGPDGATAMSADGEVLDVGVLPARVVDTNGAGDSFAAGMLAARLAGRPLAECLAWGAAAGSLCVASPDLVPRLDRETVARLAGRVTVTRRT